MPATSPTPMPMLISASGFIISRAILSALVQAQDVSSFYLGILLQVGERESLPGYPLSVARPDPQVRNHSTSNTKDTGRPPASTPARMLTHTTDISWQR